MSKSFIDDIRSIVIDNMSNESFGVRELASSLNLSSSQTLRKVKAATGKSVNQFIRELRLEKAAKLLKNTDFTATEIAYKVGFNSASYFNKTFSKYFGITPGEYKTRNISLNELAAQKPEVESQELTKNKKLVYLLITALFAIIGYFFITDFILNQNQSPNSIAVLPFKDFSPEDNQWFSDGISDNILHSLAQIKDISVTSFTSSSTYRDSDKRIPVIAKELGVTYILEGSVTRLDDKIKIIAQLIDSNDQHIWSKEYNESLDDLISIQNNVAQEVMNQMQVTLSPQEEVTLSKHPTENMEAYSLFLKGRLVNNSRNQDDLRKNIELNKQAIVLDSSFAEAYAEVAHSYWQLARFHGYKGIIDAFEGIDLAHKYADSALKVNPNTFRAWSVKAALSQYHDWDKANEYYKKALSINPNDALTHLEYAFYFQLRPNPDIEKYLEHLTISQQLNPISWLQAGGYMRALVFNNKLKEAEAFLKRNQFQFSDNEIRWHEYRIIAYRNKDWSKVVPFLKTKLEKYPDSSLYYAELAFASTAILNDDKAAVEYMKQAYAIDSTSMYNVVPYIDVLLEAKKFEEADRFMASQNYKTLLPMRFQLHKLWYSYYLKGETDKALELSKNDLFTNDYLLQVLTYAQLGDRKKVDSINKRHLYGTGYLLMWRANKAILHAVLKDRDSMYYYLENLKFDDFALDVNRRTEFDPYRDEERYKAFLRKTYIPVSEN
jgi:TolB-like protein/AraC-like DNA-binding protein/predicted Zn-dependent protease